MTKPRNLLFLDLDGVLTTAGSRAAGGACAFKPECVAELQALCAGGHGSKPDLVVVHSSWRKLPEPPPGPYQPPHDGWWYWSLPWFMDHCRAQGLTALADLPIVEAAWKFSSRRGTEVAWWLADHGQPDDRVVVVDDEAPDAFDYVIGDDDRVLLVATNDVTGITDTHVAQIVNWWTGT